MMSIPVTQMLSNFTNMVSKQVVDIVDMANSVDNISKGYRRQLELDTLSTSGKMKPTVMSPLPTQIFSNIKIDGVLVQGKQDTGAEINTMPLNVYDQLNLKLQGKLQLRPCGVVKVYGYSKQSVNIVEKISVTCTHTNVIKNCIFYVTDIVDTKVILGLNFCRTFNLVTVNCDDQCICKQITVDIINSEFPKGLEVPNQQKNPAKPHPVDTNLKLRPDCKAHILELFPDLFDRVCTIKDAIIKLDVNESITPVIQPPRKIPQAMVELLKHEIDCLMDLGVIRKLDTNEATDWCHNLILVHKPNGKLRVCLDPRTINKALHFNVHNARTFQDMTSTIRRISNVSKIDANSGLWTLPMDENSELLMTFNTPWG